MGDTLERSRLVPPAVRFHLGVALALMLGALPPAVAADRIPAPARGGGFGRTYDLLGRKTAMDDPDMGSAHPPALRCVSLGSRPAAP
jgi:hypothetical protein